MTGKLGVGNKEQILGIFFASRAIKLWNELPAGVLATSSCRPHSFRKSVRKVFISRRELRWVVATLSNALGDKNHHR